MFCIEQRGRLFGLTLKPNYLRGAISTKMQQLHRPQKVLEYVPSPDRVPALVALEAFRRAGYNRGSLKIAVRPHPRPSGLSTQARNAA